MNFSRNEESKKPRKRFLVRKAAELVRSVKPSHTTTETEESYLSASVKKFSNLFSESFRVQPQ